MPRVEVQTTAHEEMVDVTGLIQGAVTASGILEGVAIVSCRHTTAGMAMNENADPDVGHDILEGLRRLIPRRASWQKHREGNSDAHLKSALVGTSVTIPLSRGRLSLGNWQAVYFCEFDGPRVRAVDVTVLGSDQAQEP